MLRLPKEREKEVKLSLYLSIYLIISGGKFKIGAVVRPLAAAASGPEGSPVSSIRTLNGSRSVFNYEDTYN